MLTTIHNGLVDRRMQTWSVRSEPAVVPVLEDIGRPDTWRRRALTHLGTWLQAALLVWLVGFAIVVVGIPIVLLGRGAIELVTWIAGALG